MKLPDQIEETLEFIAQQNFNSKKDSFLRLISKYLGELFDVRIVLINKYSIKKPDITETVTIYNNGDFMPNLKYELKFTPCENVIDKKLCVYPKNVQEIFPKDDLLVQMDVESYIGIPLWSSKGEPIGLIAIMDNKQIKNSKSIEIILQIVAIKVAQELEKQLYENKLEIQIQDLKASKEVFRAIVENTSEWIWEVDTNSIFTYSNSVVEDIFGYSHSEIIHKNMFDLIHLPDRKVITKILSEKIEQKEGWKNIEIRWIRKDGVICYLESSAVPILNKKGILQGFRGVNRDITERKNAEKDNKRLLAAVEQSSNIVLITDTEGNIEYSNPIFTDITGYTAKEVLGKNFKFLNSGNQPEGYYEKMWNTISKGKIWKEECLNKTKKGELFWEHETITPIKNNSGKIINYLTVRENISALKESERKLQHAQNIAQLGSYNLDFSSGFWESSTIMNNLFGIAENYKKDIAGWIQLIHKEDRAMMLKYFEINIFKNHEYFDKEYRIIRMNDHEERWMHGLGELEFDKNGKLQRMIGTIQDITTQKQAQVELQERHSELKQLTNELSEKNRMLLESKDRFKEIFDQSPVSLWEEDFSVVKQLLNKKKAETGDLKTYLDKNPDFVKECVSKIEVLNVNEKALELLGVKSKEELLSHLKKTNNSKSFDVLKREFLSIASGEKEFMDEAEFIRTDGEVITTIIKSAKDHSGKTIVSLVDITALKDAKKELRKAKEEIEESEKKFRELFEKSGDAILIIKNGIFIDCNQATVEMLNYKSKEEFLNSPPSKLSPELQPDGIESKVKAEEMLALSLSNGTHRFEWMHTKRDGKIFPVEVLLTAISNEPNNKIIHVVWRDITERVKAEKKLLKQYNAIQKAKDKAEESDLLKTEFLNNMSHEIRTPMNGILGFSQLLNDPELEVKKRQNFVRIIQNSGNQLLKIIDDILEISTLGTKQVKAIEEEVCLNDLLLELFSIFDIRAKENKTPLYLEKTLSDEDSVILTDSGKLNKILSNLLDNALKFTNQGYISFGYEIKNKKIVFFVKDTGIGIKKKKLKIIFERFSQAEKELSKKVGGLGLGLSIAKENAELLGGEISVESEMMEGSIFRITIPYKPKYTDMKKKKKMNNRQKEQIILIVEDEEVNFMFIEILLLEKLKIPCTVLHANNGQKAVEICKNNADIVVVLMDIKMPVMNGYEATKLIKEFRPDLPIIAQTAYSTSEDKNKALQLGFIDFLSKPISKETLNNSIKKYIKGKG